MPNELEVCRNPGNIPHGLSPVRKYVAAGAEGGETSSTVSTYDDEQTLEEELDNFFSNPSHRAMRPLPLIPIDSDNDWRDTSPVPLPTQTPREPHNQHLGLREGRDICRGEEKEGDKVFGKGTLNKTPTTIKNFNYLCHSKFKGKCSYCVIVDDKLEGIHPPCYNPVPG